MFPPRLKTRGYRGSTDLGGMVAVHNARAAAEGREDFTSVAELATSYQHLQRCDPETDIVIVEDDAGETVGYGRTTWDDVSEGYRAYYAVVEGGPGPSELETAIFDWVEARIEKLAAEHDVAARRIEAWTDETSPRARLLTDRGFQVFRYGANLVRPTLDEIEERSLPDGVEIRAVEDSHLRPIWEAEVDAFRDHRGYAEQTEVDWESWLEQPNWDPSLWRVAWHGDQVVGQVRSFIDRSENERLRRLRGWVEDISTRREWRGRGVAGALICASLAAVRDRGMQEAALGVDTENPTGALHLYESLGFRQERLFGEYQRPL